MMDAKICDFCEETFVRGAEGSWYLNAGDSNAHYDLCSRTCVVDLLSQVPEPELHVEDGILVADYKDLR